MAGAPGQSSTVVDAACTKRILVAMVGTWRSYHVGFAGLQKHVISVNPSATYSFFADTDPEGCGAAPPQTGCACEHLNITESIRGVLGQESRVRLHRVVAKHMHGAARRLSDAWDAVLRHEVENHDVFLVLRPDVTLTRPLRICDTCSRLGGANVISGTIRRNFVFHSKDADWGFLACPPKALGPWMEMLARPNHTMPRMQPSLPRGFDGYWGAASVARMAADWHRGDGFRAGFRLRDAPIENALLKYERARTRLGTLDEDDIFLFLWRPLCGDHSGTRWLGSLSETTGLQPARPSITGKDYECPVCYFVNHTCLPPSDTSAFKPGRAIQAVCV